MARGGNVLVCVARVVRVIVFIEHYFINLLIMKALCRRIAAPLRVDGAHLITSSGSVNSY